MAAQPVPGQVVVAKEHWTTNSVGKWEDSGEKEDSRLGEYSKASWGVDRLHEGANRQDRTAHHGGA